MNWLPTCKLFSKQKYFWYLFLLLIIGLVTFWPTFSMGLYGDEWLILWFAQASAYHNFFTPDTIWSAYGIEMSVLGFLSSIFGYTGFYYYFGSFLCRLLSAYTFFWFLNKRLGAFVAFIGSLLFLVNPVGIEATDWVRNFDSYLGISILLLIADRLLLFRSLTDFLVIFLLTILLYLVNPLRSHGNILVLISLCVPLFFQKRGKWMIALIGSFVILYLFFIKLNLFGGHVEVNELIQVFNLSMISKSYLINIGRSVVPNIGFFNLQVLVLTVLFFSWKILTFSMKAFYKRALGVLIVFIGGVIILTHILFPDRVFADLLVGLYMSMLLGLLLLLEIYYRKFFNLGQTLLVGSIFVSYMFFPALRQPDFRANFEHRYLIYNALVTPLLLTFALNQIFKQKNKISSVFIGGVGLFLIVFYSFNSFLFLERLQVSHDYKYGQIVWSQIDEVTKDIDFQTKRPGFVIVSDTVTSSKLGNSVQFGFGFHLGLLKQVHDEQMVPYLITENKEGIKKLSMEGDKTGKYYKMPTLITPQDIVVLTIYNDKVKRIPLSVFLDDQKMVNANP